MTTQADRVRRARADHGVGAVQGVRGVPGHDGRARLLRLSSRQGALVKVVKCTCSLAGLCVIIRQPL